MNSTRVSACAVALRVCVCVCVCVAARTSQVGEIGHVVGIKLEGLLVVSDGGVKVLLLVGLVAEFLLLQGLLLLGRELGLGLLGLLLGLRLLFLLGLLLLRLLRGLLGFRTLRYTLQPNCH